MSLHTISSSQNSGLSITTNGDIWTVQEDVVISDSAASAIILSGDENRLTLNGLVNSLSVHGLGVIGSNNKVTIGESGEIAGDQGAIYLAGDSNRIVNEGIVGTTKNGVYSVTEAGNNAEFINHGSILTSGTSVRAFASTGDDATLSNDGIIVSSVTGVSSDGDDFTLRNAGTIESTNHVGVSSSGRNFSLVNSGTIKGDGWGVTAGVDNFSIVNAKGASISGVIGIALNSAGGASGKIDNHGTISGDHAIYGGSGGDMVTNHGTMIGNIQLASGNDTLISKGGTWIGDQIILGSGNDLIDMRGGTFIAGLSPFVFGGLGNDTYILDKAAAPIVENVNNGVDTIKTMVSFNLGSVYNVENLSLLGRKNTSAIGDNGDNVLIGNRGNNVMVGMGGEDTIDGGKGVDTLRFDPDAAFGVLVANLQTGNVFGTDGQLSIVTDVENLVGTSLDDTLIGNGSKNRIVGGKGDDLLSGMGSGDVFVFAGSFGEDRINDFGGKDRIDFSNGPKLFSDFGDLMKHTTQDGNDVIIAHGSDTITLIGVDKAALEAGDFLF